ncbi:hypothetical protein [Paenibacillus athensensis]|nr:hypothetical protein [Paenibacillus athensensis]
MTNKDSKTQAKQEQENRNWTNKASSAGEGVVDKKLDGPNRPAE